MVRPKITRTVELHKMFALHETDIVQDGKVKPPKSEIWINFAEKFSSMSTKAIYTAALKWCKTVQRNNIDETTIHHDMSIIQSIQSTSNSSSDMDFSCVESESVKFKVELSANVWTTINPVSRTYARKRGGIRVYSVLKPGVWTNVILDEISKKRSDITCTWIFQTNKCYHSGVEFVTVRAKCKICKAILAGGIEKEPKEGESAIFGIDIRGLDVRRHENIKEKATKIVGDYAKRLYESTKPATAVRRDILRRKASIFKKPAGRVPTANAIRCGKYRLRQKQKLSSCPYTALSYLKWSTKYMNTIHHIGNDPFSVIICSPDQIKLFKAYKIKNRFSKVTCDATGGVANKLDRPGEQKSGDIFYYTMVISDGFQVPIYSLLSELNDANYLTYWMSEWVKRTGDIPRQFASDMSMALLNAAVRSFTHCSSVAEYVDLMFDLLYEKTENRRIPQCYVRIDIAHFMKNVTRCEAIRNSPKKVRDFFIRCVAILIQIDDMQMAKEHISSVLIVATSLTEGNSTRDHQPVPCEAHKKIIVRKITGETISDVERADTVEESVLKDTFDDTLKDTSMSLWLNDIRTEVAKTVAEYDNGDRDNLMYNPQFVPYFINLCQLYPLWSGICCQFFNGSDLTASTGNVESHFKVVKQTLEGKIPCSVDKFVQETMDMVDGMIIDASQSYIQFISNTGDMNFDANATDELDQCSDTEPGINVCIAESDKSSNCSLPLQQHTDESLYRLYHDTNGRQIDEQNEHEQIIITTNDESDRSTHDNSATDFNIMNTMNAKSVEFDQSTNAETSNNNTVNTVNEQFINSIDSINDAVCCPACEANDFPSGAHKCIQCRKNVHILKGCSVACGDEEGYGEDRICVSCNYKQQQVINEMGCTEKWSRQSKRDIKKSKYLMPVPHWDLGNYINRNVKIGFLLNGNKSLRVFKSYKDLIALKNTSTFDSLAQVLAALFAYIPTCRTYIENLSDEIFEIAIALAKNEHMKKVNTMRAQLLCKINYEMEMSSMIKVMLKNSPSYTEVWECGLCKNSNREMFPFLLMNNVNDITKLNDAITLPGVNECEICHNMEVYFHRQFNDHLLITLTLEGENGNEFRLRDIPDLITLKDKYILFGAMLYVSPLLENDVGRYIGAIKINESWSIFDDTKTKPIFVSKHKAFIVHTLLYTKKADLSAKSTESRKLTGNASSRTPKIKRLTKVQVTKKTVKQVANSENLRNVPEESFRKFSGYSKQRQVRASTPKSKVERVTKKAMKRAEHSEKVRNVREESFRESTRLSKGKFVQYR